jgi:hypothetical protein
MSIQRPHDAGAVVAAVEEAKRELLTAVPSPRGVPIRQIADALLAYEQRLGEALELTSAWVPGAGGVLASAIEEALRRAERLRVGAPPLDYEALVAVIADLMEPLDAFAEERVGE